MKYAVLDIYAQVLHHAINLLHIIQEKGNCSEPVLNSYASGDASHPESPDAT